MDHNTIMPHINRLREESKDYFSSNGAYEHTTYPLLHRSSDLYIHMGPIYYMFDHIITKNIGASKDDMFKLFHGLNAFDMFNIYPNDIIFVPIKQHASVLYRFNFDEKAKYYLYYSNSGRGTGNHPMYKSNNNHDMVCPKIFLFNNSILRYNFGSELIQIIPVRMCKKHIYQRSFNIAIYFAE